MMKWKSALSDINKLRKHEFRDPVHGFITVFEHEKKILDTPEFQRLRRIHQLGLQSYAYHGAEHSRFGHSLGVMHLAGEVVAKIWDKREQDLLVKLGEDTSDKALFQKLYLAARLAGLLHDIGHAPFSHSGEGLFEKGWDHEDYSVEIISKTKISSLIDEYYKSTGVSAEDVVNIISKHGVYYGGPFIKNLVDSPWDVDKMDYLLRDSIYCGVEYGRYDLHRLVDSLTLDENIELAIQEDGIHTLEQLILARYFMFTQVYFHDVRRAFDLILIDFIGDCLQEKYGRRTYPTSLSEYIAWDDDSLLSIAKASVDASKRNLAWRIIERKHYKTVYESPSHAKPVIVRRVEELKDKCEKKFKGVRFWLDRAVDHPEKFTLDDLQVIPEDGGNPKSLVEECKVLEGLSMIAQCRIYADVGEDPALFQLIKNYCRSYMH